MEIDWHKGYPDIAARLKLPLSEEEREARLHRAARRSYMEMLSDHLKYTRPKRPTRDENFMRIAEVVSERATCPRARIGAVIVSAENRILSTGYNGAPPGEPHCTDVGCDVVDGHCQRAIHAEVNAVVFARGSLAGSRLYVYGRGVCRECAKVLKAAGVSW